METLAIHPYLAVVICNEEFCILNWTVPPSCLNWAQFDKLEMESEQLSSSRQTEGSITMSKGLVLSVGMRQGTHLPMPLLQLAEDRLLIRGKKGQTLSHHSCPFSAWPSAQSCSVLTRTPSGVFVNWVSAGQGRTWHKGKPAPSHLTEGQENSEVINASRNIGKLHRSFLGVVTGVKTNSSVFSACLCKPGMLH